MGWSARVVAGERGCGRYLSRDRLVDESDRERGEDVGDEGLGLVDGWWWSQAGVCVSG
jgi:hypothetical protein